MIKLVSVLLIVMLALSISSVAFAKTPSEKFVRGVSNVLSGWLEVPKTIGEEWKASHNAGIGFFAGTLKGMCFWFGRTVSGLWDFATFPLALPKGYEPIYSPDYVFNKTTTNTSTTTK